MSTRRITRRAAVRMLDEPQSATDHPVGAVLAAASAPADRTALSGEEQAVAAFLAGAPLSLPVLRTTSPMASLIRKAVAAPVLSLGIAGLVATGGGLALAASQGAVHIPFTGHDDRSDQAPTAPSSTNPGVGQTHGAQPGTPGAGPTAGPGAPGASPSPSLEGLCRAYQAGAAQDDTDNPAFAALNAAAEGAENVATYCIDLIGTPGTPAKPTQAAH